jgi:tyrosyl-tRNA synthetase
MDNRKKFELITQNTEEVLTNDDLLSYLKLGIPLKHYIGFEISGNIHLGTGLMCMSKIRDFMKAGVTCSVFLADWHTWINDKLGGDRDLIKKVAVGYFKEGFKTSLQCVGGNPDDVKFVLGSDLYHHNDKYWETMIEISKHTTLGRMQRSITIMGRKEGESLDFAKMIYPPMQVADIFTQGITMPHAGLDQRKAQVIARDVALKLSISPLQDKKKNNLKPIAVHHHLILGLQKPPKWPVPKDKLQDLWSTMKMSKSIPQSAIFIHDSPEEIKQKLSKAFCPEKEIFFNPILDWVRYLVFSTDTSEFLVERSPKFGGDVTYTHYQGVESDFLKGNLHPLDLKKSLAEKLITILEPARRHFKKPKYAKMLSDFQNLKLTR